MEHTPNLAHEGEPHDELVFLAALAPTSAWVSVIPTVLKENPGGGWTFHDKDWKDYHASDVFPQVVSLGQGFGHLLVMRAATAERKRGFEGLPALNIGASLLCNTINGKVGEPVIGPAIWVRDKCHPHDELLQTLLEFQKACAELSFAPVHDFEGGISQVTLIFPHMDADIDNWENIPAGDLIETREHEGQAQWRWASDPEVYYNHPQLEGVIEWGGPADDSAFGSLGSLTYPLDAPHLARNLLATALSTVMCLGVGKPPRSGWIRGTAIWTGDLSAEHKQEVFLNAQRLAYAASTVLPWAQ